MVTFWISEIGCCLDPSNSDRRRSILRLASAAHANQGSHRPATNEDSAVLRPDLNPSESI